MEQPSKFLATSATRGMRFMDLPDPIAHKILSILPIEDLARVSVASTRCRELCRSVPSLIIDNKKYKDGLGDRQGFCNYIDRFLGVRFKLGLEMQCFCLRWHCSIAEQYRVETWLCYAFYSNVEELDLEITLQSENKPFALPLSVSRPNSLRSLKLNMHKAILKLPASSSGFTALQSLRLQSVRIKQESFGEWVSSCCKSLTKLYIQDLYGPKTINIVSSSLADLRLNFNSSDICHIKISAPKLHTLFMNWYPNSSSRKSLIVTAPNLRLLVWVGYTLNYHYRVEKFMHLSVAVINLLKPPPQLTENEPLTGLNLIEMVRSVSKAKSLHFGGQFVELLFMRGCLPFSVDDLRSLLINVCGLNGTLVPAIASLLKGTPALEHLRIWPYRPLKNNYTSSEEIGFNIEYWESQNLRFIDQLKTATIKFCGGQNDLGLLKYLLRHAKELKAMKVYFSPSLPSRILTEVTALKNFSDKVQLHHWDEIRNPGFGNCNLTL